MEKDFEGHTLTDILCIVQLILAVCKQDCAFCEESMKFGTEVENDKPNILRPGATLNSHPELSNRLILLTVLNLLHFLGLCR